MTDYVPIAIAAFLFTITRKNEKENINMVRFILTMFIQAILLASLALLSPSTLIVVTVFIGLFFASEFVTVIDYSSIFHLTYVFSGVFTVLVLLIYLLQMGMCTTISVYEHIPLLNSIAEKCLTQNYFFSTMLTSWFLLISSAFFILFTVGPNSDLVAMGMMFLAGIIFASFELFGSESIPLVMGFLGLILTLVFFLHRTYSSIWHMMTKLGISLCLYGLMNAISKVMICGFLSFMLDQGDLMTTSRVCTPQSIEASISFQTIFIIPAILYFMIYHIYDLFRSAGTLTDNGID